MMLPKSTILAICAIAALKCGIVHADLSIYDIKPTAPSVSHSPATTHRSFPQHRSTRSVETPSPKPTALTVSQATGSRYTTISAALNRIASGGVVTVEPGIYVENLTLLRPVSVVADSASPSGSVIVESSNRPALTAHGVHGTVRGITFQGSPDAAATAPTLVDIAGANLVFDTCTIGPAVNTALAIRGPGTTAVIKNCKVAGGALYGIDITEFAKPTVTNCTVTCGGIAAVRVADSAAPVISGCRLVGGKHADDSVTNGIAFLSDTGASGSVVNCDIGPSELDAVRFAGGGLTLSGCRIHDSLHSDIGIIDCIGTPLIENCEIDHGNWGSTIRNSSARFVECKIHDDSMGLYCSPGTLTAFECQMYACDFGLVAEHNSTATMSNCYAHDVHDDGFNVTGGSTAAFNYCDVSNAGHNGYAIDSSDTKIAECLISNVGGSGVFDTNGSVNLNLVNVTKATSTAIATVNGGTMTATNCVVHDCRSNGFDLNGGVSWLSNCNIDHVDAIGISIGAKAQAVSKTDVSFAAIGIRFHDSGTAILDNCAISNCNEVAVDQTNGGAMGAAIASGSAETVSLLASHGASPTLPDGNGSMIVTAIKAQSEDAAIALLQAGSAIDTTDSHQDSPLHLACKVGYDKLTAALVARGANLSPRDDSGWTPFALAAFGGHIQCARILLNAGVDVNERNSFGTTAAIWAAEHDDIAMMRLLIEHNADLQIGDLGNLETPIIKAVQGSDTAMVDILLSHGDSVNDADSDGSTVLMFAARAGQLAMVNYLIAHGANVNLGNQRGETPMSEARGGNHQDVIAALLAAGETK